ncbi:hypothetical protein IGI37_002079 [Enterococcus sp. AZ194]|uniref:hypothetical protein n=1 Tax=Enterococcus sp. AZ194 TaxID=2774629 RepID=UPI003F279596
MNEADVLASTYLDTCVIERLMDVENDETGLTEQTYQLVYDSPLPCGLSQGSQSGLAVVEHTNVVNVTQEEQKLFMAPGIDVIKGDRLTITQSTGHVLVLFAKKPFFYPSHTEIGLIGSEIDG